MTPGDNMTAKEALDRLRTIVDEAFGLQPVLGWDPLLDLVEQETHARWKKAWALREAAFAIRDARLADDRVKEEAAIQRLFAALVATEAAR